MHEKIKNLVLQYQSEKQKVRDQLGELDVDASTILKRILGYDNVDWTYLV
jgi:hypothetical protein